jgi:hypothetical protein
MFDIEACTARGLRHEVEIDLKWNEPLESPERSLLETELRELRGVEDVCAYRYRAEVRLSRHMTQLSQFATDLAAWLARSHALSRVAGAQCRFVDRITRTDRSQSTVIERTRG